ncbi:MAG: peptidase M15 [Tannerellaceae bacterium]|jgi:hypothetical protein|nr:peptidase M15 [Tannerellaceae bacterium]
MKPVYIALSVIGLAGIILYRKQLKYAAQDAVTNVMGGDLTRNFSLSEFLRSDTADRLNATEQYNPPAGVVQNLKHLAEELQIIRDAFGKSMPVSSGYRCEVVNKAVGGVNSSAHLEGLAADINMGSKAGNKALYDFVAELVGQGKYSVDQLINENNYSWVHFGYKANRSSYRNQVFAA